MTDKDKVEAPHLDRRMLAIMATDVVGFSRQMEQDEIGTLARVTAARVEILEPLLERHRGRLIKLMGDGTLSIFDSVVDAVNCAAAIQRTAAERNKSAESPDRLVMRIGINVGDIAHDVLKRAADIARGAVVEPGVTTGIPSLDEAILGLRAVAALAVGVDEALAEIGVGQRRPLGRAGVVLDVGVERAAGGDAERRGEERRREREGQAGPHRHALPFRRG